MSLDLVTMHNMVKIFFVINFSLC